MIRRFEHCPIHGKLPAMIEAPDAAFFDPRQRERSTTMHAKFIEEANQPVGIAESNELLAQNRQAQRRAVRMRKLRRSANRHPIAPHNVAEGSARPTRVTRSFSSRVSMPSS